MTSPLSRAVAERLESLQSLDPPAQAIGKAVRSAIPGGPVKDALSGTWLGHPLHPLLTDVPIGAYTSAVILDVLGEGDAATKLIAVGLAATPSVLITGWSDWADAETGNAPVRRTGILHAAVNGTATGLMAASLAARRNGARGRGRLLSLAGLGLIGAGGWLGGHLSYARGVGVDTTVFDPGPESWTATDVADADLTDGRPTCALAAGVPVLLVREGAEIRALHNRCTHRGAPLAEGNFAAGTITCPWHGSVFSLADGSVRRGPAAYPQPAFDARVTGGQIEVRRRAS